MRRQEEGESVDLFITSAGFTAEQNFATIIHDELIRYRIIVGLRDSNLSERLLHTYPELNLY